jgi:hypothetical protein
MSLEKGQGAKLPTNQRHHAAAAVAKCHVKEKIQLQKTTRKKGTRTPKLRMQESRETHQSA